MSIRHNFTKYILSLFVCLLTIFATSCDMINTPVKDFFSNSAGLIAGQGTDKSDGSSTEPGKSDPCEEVTNPDDSESDSTTDTPADTPSPEPEPGPVTPDTSEFDDIDLTTSLVYYVSSAGDDDASGEKDSPFQTIDKALTELKANSDSQKNNGYVLLLDDIVISEEINLEKYRFDQLSPDIVDLTIAGYGALRTINAESGCRVIKVGYTNGNLTFKNLSITSGYSYDAGGAGMYITSTSCAGKTCLIENCIITDNMSSEPGAAIALETEYKVEIKKSQITANNGYDGAAAIDLKYITGVNSGLVLVISDTVIDDNHSHVTASLSSYDYGFVLNTSGLSIARLDGSVVIKNNTIDSVPPESDYSKLCAVQTVSGLELSGANTIKDNLIGLGDASGTEYTRNMILGRTSSAAVTTTPTIYIRGNCEGSSIGVSLPYTKDNPVSIANAVTFTSDYTSSGNTASPGSIFVSDCSYAIGYSSDGNEAAFVVNSGSFGNPLDNTMSFVMTQKIIPSGMASTLTVTPVVKNLGSDITASVLSDISWELTLMSGSVSIKSSTTNTLEVSAGRALPDTYTLYVTATLNGIAYDDSVSIVCMDVPEGMVYAPGASVNGAVSNSGVFVSGRSLTIPAMYAGESELTQKEYLEYCYYAHSGKEPDTAFTGDNYPACMVSWYDAIVYCNLRSMAEGLTPAYSLSGQTDPRLWDGIVSGSGANAGKYCGPLNNTDSWNNITFNTSANGWRIPVEAEWEYLARGGNLDSATQTAYAGSDDWTEVAWTTSNSSTPQLVKQKAANSLGLYDMSGNVYEYVWDWYGGNISSSDGITGKNTPVEVTESGYSPYRRVVRGGAYNYGSAEAKISDRSVKNTPEMRWWNCGVRIVRNVN